MLDEREREEVEITYTESGVVIVAAEHGFEIAVQSVLRRVVAAVAEVEAADEGGDFAVVAVVLGVDDHAFLVVSVDSSDDLLFEDAKLVAPVTRGEHARDRRVLEELARLLVMRFHHSGLHEKK